LPAFAAPVLCPPVLASLLVVIVVAIIVGWVTVGDRPGPMISAALYQSEDCDAKMSVKGSSN
jgi:hypothetical protein